MKVFLILMAILIPVVGIWWFLRHRATSELPGITPTSTPKPPTPNPAASNTSAVENAIQKATGVPVGAIGKVAASQPTAVKLAFATTVGVTALAHNLITHPKAELKSIGKSTVAVGKAIISAPVHPVDTAKHIGGSVVSAGKSIASAGKSIGSAAKKLKFW